MVGVTVGVVVFVGVNVKVGGGCIRGEQVRSAVVF